MYEPYPIADVVAGLYDAKEPWLAPEKTWRGLEDMVIRRGRLEVRRGRRVFGVCRPRVVNESHAGYLGETVTSGTLTVHPVHPGEQSPSLYRVTLANGAKTVTDDGAGVLSGDGDGTIDYVTGDWSITWDDPCGADAIIANYETLVGLSAILGIVNTIDGSTRTERVWVFTNKRIYLWDEGERRFRDAYGFDIDGGITSEPRDRYVVCPFRDAVYITNWVRPPLRVESGVITGLTLDTDGDGNNNVDAVRTIVRHRDRVLYGGLKIDGTYYANLVWLSVVNNPEVLDIDRSTFIPSENEILASVAVGDTILYFLEGNETWALRYTGDDKFPYEWEQIAPHRGCDSALGAVAVGRVAFALGTHALVQSDGLQVEDADQATHPNLIRDNVSSEYADWTTAVVVPEHEEVWWSFVSTKGLAPNKTLVMGLENASFSLFSFGVNCFGRYRAITALDWDDVPGNFDDVALVPDDYRTKAGFPTLLAGDFADTGIVWELDVGEDDNGAEIVGSARSQALNPYRIGRARLGHVDIFGDAKPTGLVRLSMARSFVDAPYLEGEKTLASETSTKVRRRWAVNQIADAHSIRLEARGFAGAGIDAITPWFSRDGGPREIR